MPSSDDEEGPSKKKKKVFALLGRFSVLNSYNHRQGHHQKRRKWTRSSQICRKSTGVRIGRVRKTFAGQML